MNRIIANFYLYLTKTYRPFSTGWWEVAAEYPSILEATIRSRNDQSGLENGLPELVRHAAAALGVARTASCTMYFVSRKYEAELLAVAARRVNKCWQLRCAEYSGYSNGSAIEGAPFQGASSEWKRLCSEVYEYLYYLIVLGDPIWTYIHLMSLPTSRSGWKKELASFFGRTSSWTTRKYEPFCETVDQLDKTIKDVESGVYRSELPPWEQKFRSMVHSWVAQFRDMLDESETPCFELDTLRARLSKVIVSELHALDLEGVSKSQPLRNALSKVVDVFGYPDRAPWDVFEDIRRETRQSGCITENAEDTALLRFLRARHPNPDPNVVFREIVRWRKDEEAKRERKKQKAKEKRGNAADPDERISRDELTRLHRAQVERATTRGSLLGGFLAGDSLDTIRTVVGDLLSHADVLKKDVLKTTYKVLKFWEKRWTRPEHHSDTLWLDMPRHLRDCETSASNALPEIRAASRCIRDVLPSSPTTWNGIADGADHEPTTLRTIQGALFVAAVSDLHQDLCKIYEARKTIRLANRAKRRIGTYPDGVFNKYALAGETLIEVVLGSSGENAQPSLPGQVAKEIRRLAEIKKKVHKEVKRLEKAAKKDENKKGENKKDKKPSAEDLLSSRDEKDAPPPDVPKERS